MDSVYKELNDVKAEMGKLRADYQIKTELCESLREGHNEQLIKFEEAKLQIEKQATELNAKLEQISDLRRISEELQSILDEKESFLRHVTTVSEKLQNEFLEKIHKLEGENRELVLALDESTVVNTDLEKKIHVYDEELESLRKQLSISHKKCLQAEEKAQAPMELRQRDEMILKLEVQCRSINDQLKWKKEQFKHLEDAHEKLQGRFQLEKKELEKEKIALVEEICSIKTTLDSQIRISEGLQIQLKMCNQALAHEESKRKLLEVQLSESKSCFENVFTDYQEAMSKVESLSAKTDEEVAALRNLLRTKEVLYKEMEFKIAHLAEENLEIRESLKEFQEAQIQNPGATSLHWRCSKNCKEKESKLSSRIAKMTEERAHYLSDLNGKDVQIQTIEKELESTYSSMEVLNEECSIVLMLLKMIYFEAYSKLWQEKQEREEMISHLTEQLNLKNIPLNNANLIDVFDAFGKANCRLAGNSSEANAMELELQKWKITAESLKACLEERQEEKQEKHNYVRIIEEKESSLKSLQEEIAWIKQETMKKGLESSILASIYAEKTFEQEKKRLLTVIKEKDMSIQDLQELVVSIEAELTSLVLSSFTEVTEKRIEIDVLCEALEKLDHLRNLEIQIRDNNIVELETEANNLSQKLDFMKNSLSHSKQHEEQLEDLLEVQQSKIQELRDQYENEKTNLESLVKKLESENGALLEDSKKLLLEREDLLAYTERTCDKIAEVAAEDVLLNEVLQKLLKNFDENNLSSMDSFMTDEFYDCSRKQVSRYIPMTKKVDDTITDRSPLKDLNF